MVRKSQIVLLLSLTAFALVVHWPRVDAVYPPPLTIARANVMDARELVPAVTTELTRRLLNDPDPTAWRSLPEASRHVWIMATWGDRLRLGGLLQTCADCQLSADGATMADIAAAYRAVGAVPIAVIIDEATGLAKTTTRSSVDRMLSFRKGVGKPPDPSRDPYAALDKRLQTVLGDIAELQANFMRENLQEILVSE